MRLVEFLPEHLDRIHTGDVNRFPLAAGMRPRPGAAFTLMDGNRVMGCAGVIPMGGHGEVWAALSDGLRSRPMLLHRMALRALRMQAAQWPMRLLAIAHRDSRTAQNWLERLGFRQVDRDADWVCYERAKATTGSTDNDVETV